MNRLLSLLLLLCGCGTETVYVSDSGLDLYQCGTQLCLEVVINGREIQCVQDSGARGQLWTSREIRDSLGLQPLWSYTTANSFGAGTVDVQMLQAVQACWQVEGQEHCEEVYPYAVEMIHECLFGLE